MKTRRADFELSYNGAAVSSQMKSYKMEVTYTDPASGEADTLEIRIQDRDTQWMTAWLPLKGDSISGNIRLENWEQEGDSRTLPCGSFLLDDFSFSGYPTEGTISGISSPLDGAFKSTERSKTWEKVTVEEIGKELASRAGITLVWDVSAPSFTIASIEQSEESDCSFYMELCEKYGYSMKLYANKLAVFEREVYKQKDSIGTLRETDIKSWSWKTTLSGTYTGGQYSYTDPNTEQDITVELGAGTRLLKLSGKADSKADAERMLQAAIDKANHGASSLSITMMGNALWVASQCITVTGLGKLSGKYYIDSITHSLGNGYEMSLELSLVDSMTEEVILDAIDRLYAVGVIDTPAYWKEHYKDVNYLDGLLLNMASRIKTNLGGNSVQDITAALEVLTSEGVINSPDYWAEKYTALPWLETLLIRAANALFGEKGIIDAVNWLASIGIIDSPSYWTGIYTSLEYLDTLLHKLASMIRSNAGRTSITDLNTAVQVLERADIINRPSYWLENASSVKYLDTLLIKAANAIAE